MKHTLLIAIACHFFYLSSAQFSPPPNFVWAKTITFPNINTWAQVFDFCSDSAGNSYVYGTFVGTLSFGNGVFLSAQSDEAYFVAKYLPDGGLDWVRRIVSPNGELIYAYINPSGISADNAGNVYISGQLSNAALDFGNGVILQRSCVGTPACSDFFVAKYNVDGVVEWVRKASGSASTFQRATRLVVGTDGTVFVGGNYEGQRLIFDDMLTYTDLDADGMYLAHYSPDGTVLSTTFFDNGNNYAEVGYLAITPQNKVLVMGPYADGDLHFGNDVSLAAFGANNAANSFVVQYNMQGNAEWAYNLYSDTHLELLDIAADTAGKPYVIVDFRTTLFSGGDLLATTPVVGDSSVVLLHLSDSLFNPVLVVPYHGETFPLANVTVDRNNRFFASGYFSDAQLAVADTVIDNEGCDDALLLSGSTDTLPLKWIRAAGGIKCEIILSDYGRALATDQAGNLYAVGAFGGSLQLDNFIKIGNGLFVAKLGTAIVGTNNPTPANLYFRLLPNPNYGDFSIETADLSSPMQLILYDIQGSICYQRSVEHTTDLDFHLHLPNGLYTAVLMGKNKIGRQKLVVINSF